MKYPTKIIIEFKKKYRLKNDYHFLTKHVGSNVFIDFKENDSRSGIGYKFLEIFEYDDVIEFKLIRSDFKACK